MDKNILKIYGLTGAYCKFMGITKMPKFKVKTFKGGNASAYISYQNNSQIFNIEENYINVLKQNALPLIYHEFTHIVDNESFLPEVSAKTKIPFIKMLSEYRAIQVQMKISMNFEIYNEDKKFSFDDKTHDWFEEKTVKEDIVYKTEDFVATKKNLLSKKENNYTYFLVLHCVYYQSMCDFWKEYCINEVQHLLKEDIINTLFGLEFDIFHHMLSKIDNKDINYFKLLLSSQNKMVGYFGLYEDEIIKTLSV